VVKIQHFRGPFCFCLQGEVHGDEEKRCTHARAHTHACSPRGWQSLLANRRQEGAIWQLVIQPRPWLG